MQLDQLIEASNIRGLVILDDENGVKVCHNFNPDTAILSFEREFLEVKPARLIMSMIDEMLENGSYDGPVIHFSGEEIAIVTPGYTLPKRFARLRAIGRFFKHTLTRFVCCGILLLFIDSV